MIFTFMSAGPSPGSAYAMFSYDKVQRMRTWNPYKLHRARPRTDDINSYIGDNKDGNSVDYEKTMV